MRIKFLILSSLALMLAACAVLNVVENSEEVSGEAISTEERAPMPEFLEISSNPSIRGTSEIVGEFVSSDGESLDYLIFYPRNYNDQVDWPVLLFFHGSDANGSDIEFVRERSFQAWLPDESEFPFIVISPQLARGNWEGAFDMLDEFWNEMNNSLPLLEGGKFVSGYSIGATASWQFAIRHPEQFDGLLPVAGGSTFSRLAPVDDSICALTEIPVWIFHGDADTAVPIENNIANQEALRECGNENIRMTIYAGATHGETWPLAYADESLVEWMLSQIK